MNPYEPPSPKDISNTRHGSFGRRVFLFEAGVGVGGGWELLYMHICVLQNICNMQLLSGFIFVWSEVAKEDRRVCLSGVCAQAEVRCLLNGRF